MLKPKHFLFVLISLFLSNLTPLQAQFNVSAEFRPRAELHQGVRYLPDSLDSPMFFTSQRTRLSFSYVKENIEIKITAQDVRIWGSEANYTSAGIYGAGGVGTTDRNIGIDLYEAYLDWKVSEPLMIRIGKQIWSYDDQYLLSGKDWSQFGMTYDAALASYKKNGWQIDLGLSYGNKTEKLFNQGYGNNDYFTSPLKMQTLNFIYLKKKISPAFQAVATAIMAGYPEYGTKNTLYLMGTYGGRLSYKKEALLAEVAGYYQNGKTASIVKGSGSNLTYIRKGGNDINAYSLFADISYKVLDNLSLGVTAIVLSGNDAKDTSSSYRNTQHVFNTMYGSRFRYFGSMNMYSDRDLNSMGGGLIDVFPNLSWKISDNNELQVKHHFISLHSPVLDPISSGPTAYLDKSLGSEMDMTYLRKFTKDLTAKVGVSYYFASRSAEIVQGMAPGSSTQPYWVYVMLTYKPVFLTSDKQ